MSISANDLSMPGSLASDGSFAIEQNSCNSKSSQPGRKRQRQNQKGASLATSQPTKASQLPLPDSLHMPNSLTQEYNDIYHMQERPRFDVRPEDILQQQQVFHQLPKQRNSLQLQGHNSQSRDLIYQQRIQHLQQRQFLQSLPQMRRDHMQQQYQQLNNHMQQKSMQLVSAMKHSTDGALYTQRLLNYMYHQRQRPLDNSIAYWRKFVAEYYAPRAKKRWCWSLWNNTGESTPGVCTDEATHAWHCDICHSKPGRGFEAVFETLPGLLKVKFDSGVIDELLYVDLTHGQKRPGGIIVLEYGKAVQQSVYKQCRVVREGQLRVVFTEKLKILSWEFCVRCQEELLPRASLTPLVNPLVKVLEKCQIPDTGNESNGKPENLQTNCYILQDAVSHLVKNLEHSTMNNFKNSKAYFWRFKISEVADIMKDLIDFSKQHKLGPIASLQNYPRPSPAAKLQIQKMQEIKQQSNGLRPLTTNMMMNNDMPTHRGLSSHENNSRYMATGWQNPSGIVSDGATNGFNTTSTRAPLLKKRGEGLVGNGLGLGNSTPDTYISGIAMGSQPCWSNSGKATSDGSYQVDGNENQNAT